MSGNLKDRLRFGCEISPNGENIEHSLQRAKQAEECGFDVLTFPDHLFSSGGAPDWEVFSVLGAVGTVTEQVEIMPGVTDSVRRHPAELAHAIATLDQLTDGCAILGIGAGEAFTFRGINDFEWDRPYTRFKECVSVVLGLWESNENASFSFDGEYFDLEDAVLEFQAARTPHPPVHVGGYGPKMRSLAGQVADGWVPWVHAPAQYEQDLETVLEAAEAADREPAAIDRAVMIPTAVSATDPEGVREELIEAWTSRLALRPSLLDDMGYSELAKEAPRMWQMSFDPDQQTQQADVADRIPREAVEEVVVAGSPEDAIEQIERFVEAGVTHPIVLPGGDVEKTFDCYKREIIPYFEK